MIESINIVEQVNPSWDFLSHNIAPDYLCQITPELVRDRKIIMVIAQDDYDYVGYSLLAPKSGSIDTYRLIHTLVIPENCMDGVATAMLNYAIDKLRKYGVKNIEAAVLEEDTEDALPFLLKNGFNKALDMNTLTYSLDQLADTELHAKPSMHDVHPINSIAPGELNSALKGQGISLAGIDSALSGILINNGVYGGFADISLSNGELRLNSITIPESSEKMVLLHLWKYASDKLIEIGESEGLTEAQIIITTYYDAIINLLGDPTQNTKSVVYKKEL